MNVMTMEAWPLLDSLIDDALADDAVKGIVITSGKAGSFAGGMDLNVIAKMKEMAGDDPAQGPLRRADEHAPHPAQDRARGHG